MGTFLANKRVSCLMSMFILSICTIFMSASTIYGQNQESPLDKIQWIHGPAKVSLGNIANINLPEGYMFANANDTQNIIMALMETPSSGNELGYVISQNGKVEALFSFEETGYIEDNEKDSLDSDAILKAITEATDKTNEERKKRGWEVINIVGWQQTPHYDASTNNLEWAIRVQTASGKQSVNYNTRLLGRKGVMSVVLICDPLKLTEVMPDYKMILANYEFSSGNRYAEFVQGDKVAKYGLTGLMLGGAAAVAAKAGVFKWLWKVLLAGFIGLAALLKKIFGKKQ